MGVRKSFMRTIKVKSPRSGQVLGVRSVRVGASLVKPSFAWKPKTPK